MPRTPVTTTYLKLNSPVEQIKTECAGFQVFKEEASDEDLPDEVLVQLGQRQQRRLVSGISPNPRLFRSRIRSAR